MRHILDSTFRYVPSCDTDVRKTFERVRRRQQAGVAGQPGPDAEPLGDEAVRVKVLLDPIEERKQ